MIPRHPIATLCGCLVAPLLGLACGGSEAPARAPTEATAAPAVVWETDQLIDGVRAAVARAEAELAVLQESAAQAPASDRPRAERAIAQAEEKLTAVRRLARRIPSERGPVWPSYKLAMAAAIDDLDRAVRWAADEGGKERLQVAGK